MRRILMVALLALGGTFAMSGVAVADIGDIQELSVDDSLFGSASEVTVTGTIDCQADVEYGLWVGVAQGALEPINGGPDTFIQDSNPAEDLEASTEGVGAFGPNFDPPDGMSDDQPCERAISGYDVVVQQNRDSGDFEDGEDLEVFVAAGSSAEDGGRGPGPFLGDILGLEDDDIEFNRTR